jgi:uncharacterized membrane protein YphA (DoxX/SURF4 family)
MGRKRRSTGGGERLMALDAGLAGILLLIGRVLFGGLLVFQGLNHFMNAEQMTGYAQAKGLPAPGFGVVASGVLLVAGGLALILGVYPAVAAGALAVFLFVSAVVFHDFWAVPEEQAQDEMVNFLKNVELAGAALVFLAISGEAWAYTVGIGL